MGQLIGVIATIYNFVRMPACGAMTANSRQRICTRGIRKPARVRSYRASASSSAIIGRDEICKQHGLSSMQAAAAIAMTAG